MERQQHIAELPDDNRVAKVVAALVAAVIVAGGTGYFVWGSGLWQPQVHHTDR
jgi:hypothetical protein